MTWEGIKGSDPFTTTMSAEQLSSDFQYYTAGEVREMRRHVLVDVAEVRSGLVAQMP